MKNILRIVSITLIIFFALGMNKLATSQSSAYCAAGMCPGGCAVTGFDWASCNSSGCVCWCTVTLGKEYDTYFTDCTSLGLE